MRTTAAAEAIEQDRRRLLTKAAMGVAVAGAPELFTAELRASFRSLRQSI